MTATSPGTMKHYLFVYGTLAGEDPPREVATAFKRMKYIGQGFVFGRLYDIGQYPGAVLNCNSRSKIFGKIYELPDDAKLLKELDAYEEFDPSYPARSLFVRRQTSIKRRNGKKVKGWVYEYNRGVQARPVIGNGRYSAQRA